MCSYMAMFPPRLPHYFIQRFTQIGDTVLDPFSGRGTTPTQACVEGRVGLASDLNPLAYVLSLAKVDPPTYEEAALRLRELESGWSGAAVMEEAARHPIRVVYHPHTLKQLTYLKQALTDSRTDTFLKATILGIMHGKYRRSRTDSIYLSIDMPNTFSMSPGYISRYVREKKIQPLPLDVFEKTGDRLKRLFRESVPVARGRAYQLDFRQLHRKIDSGSVQLVVSSPPYLKVVKYGLYNWIRLWFLGVPAKEVDKSLDDGHDLPPYLAFMAELLQQMERLLAPGGVCVMVIGDVAQKGRPPINLAATVWEHAQPLLGLQLIDLVADPIADNLKVTKIWNRTRGQATTVDRILVLCKGDRPATNNARVDWSR